MVSDEEIGMLNLVSLLKKNIEQAVEDYGKHTSQTKVLDDVSDDFTFRLAEDAAFAKRDLRNLLRKSPAWNENLQAVVINGTRTHDPDYGRVYSLGMKIFEEWFLDGKTYEEKEMVLRAINFFSCPNALPYDMESYISAIKQIAPKAYRANRKKSRIFKNICDVLGVTDESAGSDFQRLFAQFADELSGKKLDFKLFLSINPAHFLTMSNPKCDNRGSVLTSCHSFNSTEYEYNCGCSGYARDNVTMIAFTVDNPENPELLNNRKTTRQLFMYKVGNGLLLQSRMYNTSGGVYGASELTPLYRDLVQRELSALENVPNLWKTYTYCKNSPEGTDIEEGLGFGGYADWTHEDFDAKISINAAHKNDFQPFTVGTYGLCIKCGKEIDEGLYCAECGNKHRCDHCGEYFDSDDLHTVYDSNGDEIEVCEHCLNSYYGWCSHCEGYYLLNDMTRVAYGEYVCEDCLNEHYECCEDCGDWVYRDDVYRVYDINGCEIYVCQSCHDGCYTTCHHCLEDYHDDNITAAVDENGNFVWVCEDCRDRYYTQCEHCSSWYHNDLIKDGVCEHCRIEAKEESA